MPLEAVPYSEEYKDHLSKSADFLKEVKHFSDLKIGSTLLFHKNVFAFVPFSFVAFHDSSTRPRKRRTTPRWPTFSEHGLRYLFLSNRLSWRFFSCFCLYVVLVKFAIGVHLLLPRRSWTTSTASRTGSGSMLIQGYLGLHQFHLLYLSHIWATASIQFRFIKTFPQGSDCHRSLRGKGGLSRRAEGCLRSFRLRLRPEVWVHLKQASQSPARVTGAPKK